MCDFFIIAGEHSGDQHAAALVKELRGRGFEVAGVGGPAMKAAGAELLFDMTQLSVVGFFEVLKHWRVFKDYFDRIFHWIDKNRPSRVIFVDYPGFNLRLAKRLFDAGIAHKAGGPIRLLYYIAPQVWAWKAKRRFAMAKVLDALSVIFPFEVDCFADTTLPTTFVGHPFAEADFHNSIRFDAHGQLLLLPGSRQAAVKRIFPKMLDVLDALGAQQEAAVLYPSESMLALLKTLAGNRTIAFVPYGTAVKARAALMSSGTISLLCGLAGIPGIILYRAHPLTYWLGKKLAKIPHLGIVNLLLKAPIYPEFIQNIQPKIVLDALQTAADQPQFYHEQANRVRSLLTHSKATSLADWAIQ